MRFSQIKPWIFEQTLGYTEPKIMLAMQCLFVSSWHDQSVYHKIIAYHWNSTNFMSWKLFVALTINHSHSDFWNQVNYKVEKILAVRIISAEQQGKRKQEIWEEWWVFVFGSCSWVRNKIKFLKLRIPCHWNSCIFLTITWNWYPTSRAMILNPDFWKKYPLPSCWMMNTVQSSFYLVFSLIVFTVWLQKDWSSR